MQRRGLVVLGMQEGLFGQSATWCHDDGHDVDVKGIAARIDQLLNYAETAWMSSVHVAMRLEDGHGDQAVTNAMMDGSPGVSLLRGFVSRHPHVEQRTAWPGRDAFRGSDLDQLLGEHGIGQIVIAGPTIAGMLDATCRTAYALGYEVVVPADCLLSLHEAERQVYVETVLGAYVRVLEMQDIIGVAA